LKIERLPLSNQSPSSEIPDLIDLRDRLQLCLDDFDRHPVLSKHPLAAQLDLVVRRLEAVAGSIVVDDADGLDNPH
jgi:hypothetical protein